MMFMFGACFPKRAVPKLCFLVDSFSGLMRKANEKRGENLFSAFKIVSQNCKLTLTAEIWGSWKQKTATNKDRNARNWSEREFIRLIKSRTRCDFTVSKLDSVVFQKTVQA